MRSERTESVDALMRRSDALAMQIQMDRDTYDNHWREIGAATVRIEEEREQRAARLGAWLAVVSAVCILGCAAFALTASGPLILRLVLALPLLILGSAPAFRSFSVLSYASGRSREDSTRASGLERRMRGHREDRPVAWRIEVIHVVSGLCLVIAVVAVSSPVLKAVLLVPIALLLLAHTALVVLMRPRSYRDDNATRERLPVNR